MEDNLEHRVLTVINYTLNDDGTLLKTRVTIQPSAVEFVLASYSTSLVDSHEAHKVNVCYVSGNQIELYLSQLDMITIEQAVGSYFIAI